MIETGGNESERGAGLLELVAAMPLLVILCAALATAFVFGLRAYLFLLGDWALQEQVGYAMERMTADLRYAEDVKIESGDLKVLCRAGSGSAVWVAYRKTQESWPRMMLDGQPLTGQSTLGRIAVKTFAAERVGARTVLLRLVGENRLTGQEYELETAVTWTGKGT
ncbi:MAG: hypothetical protein IJ812_06295 [Schwartzia sp.]|nr:hypothetical protein [Schwartzia sp. (in: firmicutes)]MBR1886000.1 hypothetical protein [Schwartzia sp. (in: firmicutes)]